MGFCLALFPRLTITAQPNKIRRSNYLLLYELKLDDNGSLKISTIRFFWEALPPEVDGAAYAADKSKWGK
jgi:hypothetical protein